MGQRTCAFLASTPSSPRRPTSVGRRLAVAFSSKRKTCSVWTYRWMSSRLISLRSTWTQVRKGLGKTKLETDWEDHSFEQFSRNTGWRFLFLSNIENWEEEGVGYRKTGREKVWSLAKFQGVQERQQYWRKKEPGLKLQDGATRLKFESHSYPVLNLEPHPLSCYPILVYRESRSHQCLDQGSDERTCQILLELSLLRSAHIKLW